MPHYVTETDALFTVREPAWHGLDNNLPDYPTRAEAQALAHPWEPVTEPIYRRVPRITPEGLLEEHYEEVTDYQATVRSDNGDTLGVVGDNYQVVSNGTLWDIAEALEGVDKGAVRYETAGSLKGGRKVWTLLRLAEPLMVKGDPRGGTLAYFLLSNSHDGSGALTGSATQTRVVCWNTLDAATVGAEKRGTAFAFRHTANVADRIDQAKQALAGWKHSVEEYRLASEHLLTLPVTPAQRRDFIERFIPAPAPGLATERTMNNVEKARGVLTGILAGETCEGIDDTAYGLVQGAVEYLQHYRTTRGNQAESRFRRSYISPDRLAYDATRLAQMVAVG